MSDSSFLLIDSNVMNVHFKHLALLSRGRDPLFDIPVSNHLVEDQQFRIKYHLQVIQCSNQNVLTKKIEHLSKAALTYYSPYYLKLLFMTVKTGFDLHVIYEYPDTDYTLNDELRQRIETGDLFDEGDLWKLAFTLLDSFFMSGQFSGEYLDIDPSTIFMKKKEGSAVQYNLSNHGTSHLPTKQAKYFNKDDIYFRGEKSLETYIRAFTFAIGQMIYSVFTLEGTVPMEKFASKYSVNFLKFIKALINNEKERLSFKNIYFDQAANWTPRVESFYKGSDVKLAKANENSLDFTKLENFAGFISADKVPKGFADISLQGSEFFRGKINDGNRLGYGVYHDGKGRLFYGYWKSDVISIGMISKSRDFIYFGTIENLQPHGEGYWISMKQDGPVAYYRGKFSKGEMIEGLLMKKDGTIINYEAQLEVEVVKKEEAIKK